MILVEKHTPGMNTSYELTWKGPGKSSCEIWEQFKECSCSYCKGNSKLHYGLNIPKYWNSWNSWYIIKYGKGRYFRFTLPFLKLLKQTKI